MANAIGKCLLLLAACCLSLCPAAYASRGAEEAITQLAENTDPEQMQRLLNWALGTRLEPCSVQNKTCKC